MFKRIIVMGTFLILFASCKKMTEVGPPSNLTTGGDVFNFNSTASAVLSGIYTSISKSNFSPFEENLPFIGLYTGLSGDELTLWEGVTDIQGLFYYKNSLTSTVNTNVGGEFWTTLYKYIFVCNSAIEGISASTSLSANVKNHLLGEAKFLRAFFYFYLTNLYNRIPLVLSTKYKESQVASQISQAKVYEQIILDLSDAVKLLSDEYLDGTISQKSELRVRPNRSAAFAFLARVYLYSEKWDLAEQSASLVIANSQYHLEEELGNIFLNTSKEAIWQIQPVNSLKNTEEAFIYILPETGPSFEFYQNPVYLSKSLIKSFEGQDQRRQKWVDSVIVENKIYYYPYKFKIKEFSAPHSEFITPLRLSEQYLIRSEARLMQGKVVEGLEDLNVIRIRANLAPYTSLNVGEFDNAILKERRSELFLEWGHRWFDLKRKGKIDSVMGAESVNKASVWRSEWQWYPIPFSDLILAPQIKQNVGY